MYTSTQEQKEKYLGLINGPLGLMDGMIKEVSNILLSYAKSFYDFQKNIITYDYHMKRIGETKEKLMQLSQETFTSMTTEYRKIKENYLKECFPITETTDQLELNFVSKELEVMNREELEEFYKANYLDKNKVRLFDIEAKRRSRLNTTEAKAEFIFLMQLKDSIGIEDIVIKTYDNRIKFIDGCRQLSGDTICIIKGIGSDGELIPSLTSCDKVIKSAQDKCAFGRPSDINVLDLID